MRITIPATVAALLIVGCTQVAKFTNAPFPHYTFVEQYTPTELRTLVDEQDLRRRAQPSRGFKRYPSPSEYDQLVSDVRREDKVVELRNSDCVNEEDLVSNEPAFAFCVVRNGKIVKSVEVWEHGFWNEEGEPGATDNPGDAQRLREDH